jgi:hypothetical protein
MSMIDLIQQNVLTIYFLLVISFLAYLVFLFFRGRGKVLVRVKTPAKEWSRYVKPNPDGTSITMEKTSNTKAGWTFKYTNQSLQTVKKFLGLGQVVDVFYHSPKAIDYDFTQSEATQPKLTKQDVINFNNADALKRRYSKMEHLASRNLMYIVLLLVLVGIIIQLLGMAGVHFGY